MEEVKDDIKLSKDLDLISFCNPNYSINEDIINCNVTTPMLQFSTEEVLTRLCITSTAATTAQPHTTVTSSSSSHTSVSACETTNTSGDDTTPLPSNGNHSTESTTVDTAVGQMAPAPSERLRNKRPTSIHADFNKCVETNVYSFDRNALGQIQELPPGWEKHEDELGDYYWHIKTGTIQRAPPKVDDRPIRPVSFCSSHISTPPSSPDCSLFSMVEMEQAFDRASYSVQNNSITKSELRSPGSQPATSFFSTSGRSSIGRTDACTSPSLQRKFSVRSLGWMEIDHKELTPQLSSRTVNRCITRLSSESSNNLLDTVAKWGEGRELWFEIDSHDVILISPNDNTILLRQPIVSIKIWGVGRDNDRDFAYVARDRSSRRFLCHVYRCDLPARHLANALCAQCRVLVAEKRQQRNSRPIPPSSLGCYSRDADQFSISRMPPAVSGNTRNEHKPSSLVKNLTFSAPLEEPKKVIDCCYIGHLVVVKSGGIDVLNNAIDKLSRETDSTLWRAASVSVAPSTITISDSKGSKSVICECRIRFLSFMGISRSNIKLCGFIVHTVEDEFVCHVFYCEPTAGPLCKTIEAACTLRYQKCLDAQSLSISQRGNAQNETLTPTQRIKDGLTSVFTAMTRRKSKC